MQPLATKALVDRLATGESIAGVLIALTALVLLGTAVEACGAYVLERTAQSSRAAHPCGAVAASADRGVGADPTG
ncbi:ABC transporter [Streptomyces azureus]|uniref:ABC transporter n=1 Tax=Streptomyces azureus TaxID=146537 RepID=A0A0K8PHL4_STRAJ|nr:ABC transporter [Streptomyces azureus]